jgi:hypothetical protein
VGQGGARQKGRRSLVSSAEGVDATARIRAPVRVRPSPRMLDFDAAPPPFLTINYRWKHSTLGLFSALTTFGTAQDVALQELRIESFCLQAKRHARF